MKTLKLSIVTALILLAAILNGQAEQDIRFENLVNNYLSMHDRTERIGYMEPMVSMTYTLEQPEVIYEAPYLTEDWMLTPFPGDLAEADLPVEAWMTAPFECNVAESDLIVESWMTVPFQSDWAEVDPLVELWMTLPFEAADQIEIESWMTVAF